MGDNDYYEDVAVADDQVKSEFVSDLRREITNVKKMQMNNSILMKILFSALILLVFAAICLLVYFIFIARIILVTMVTNQESSRLNANQTNDFYQNDRNEQIEQIRKLVVNDIKELIEPFSQTAQDCPNDGFVAGSFCYIVSVEKMNWTAAQEVCY